MSDSENPRYYAALKQPMVNTGLKKAKGVFAALLFFRTFLASILGIDSMYT